ncbi:UbiE family methyltransferase [Saitoella complicata NRRL Y-17804]|uniref:Methyltransferase domain-containing protein n=1 Tax=Saitoella complicata (strain BCRC 22490 / CBS 7301 / JCM 7358 / NBRC 10748 / NRRL Y-17804) TaxID=698492 RepID=A0A0E9NL72_SAICN|nr:UbiE family methyltransferase [Saitoella complicata NRRL Y-17804]ODQ51751.1 UbiE family methyltransferase [Saitoella complicata NRRL Y-17804]GAO50632.1 hypothetical protein G7K_4756-t1 [Saitoella complicata NRRL Y-17804]
MPEETANYIHGHHESVLRSHSWRTAQNSAAYLLPYLEPHMRILDIGCGPGTITFDFAELVPEGEVVGLEYEGGVLEQARKGAKERGLGNIEFVVGDVNGLDYADNTFDVVHCHQVLQHVGDPVQALKEMRRVVKPGGIVAAREADFNGFTWYPENEGLEHWLDLYINVARANGGEPNAGRRLHVWAHEAGFPRKNIKCTAGTWCYADTEAREWWSNMWADRTLGSIFARKVIESGQITQDGLEDVAATWREWGKQEDGWFVLLHGEVVCRK